MQVGFEVADLLTVAGVAGVTLLLIQFFVKPLLAKVLANDPSWWGIILNFSALVFGVALAFLGQATIGLDYENALQAFLTGLGGAVTAIGSYEVGKNILLVARR